MPGKISCMSIDPALPAFGPLPTPALRQGLLERPESTEAPPAPGRTRRRASGVLRLLIALLAIWMFLTAITVMKDGAAPLRPLLLDSPLTDSMQSTLGFGWVSAMFVMSGSPVAVAALTFLAGGVINATETLTMLTGSRLGASFVVLVVAFIYALRTPSTAGSGDERGSRRASISIGIYALVLTAIVYVPALALGIPLLRSGAFNGIDAAAPPAVLDIVDTIVGPVAGLIERVVPETPGVLFLAGLVLLLASVRLVDMALPEAADTAHLETHRNWRNRRWMMFGIGSLVALVTMSVSVALTVLVPAVAKGYFRRRQVIPYIMGANITTLGDTLLTSFLLGSPTAVHVVVAELVSITLITVVLLSLVYEPLQRHLTRLTDWILDTRQRLLGFVVVLFCIPISLIFIF